ncbi:MAG: HAD family hydrolase [Propioniciclava sp.]
MSFRPRLIALDVDGTIVDESNVVPPAIGDAIRAATQAGIAVVLATGRSFVSARTILDQLDLPPTEHVLSNGAVIGRYPPATVVDMLTFDARPVVAQLRRELPKARFAVEANGRGYLVTAPFPEGELHGSVQVASLEQMIAHPVPRVVVRDLDATEADFEALTARMDLTGVSHHVGYTAWLDLAPPGVDKAHGLRRLVGRLGISSAEVLALGDGRNDAAMLGWAGRGVAIAGAPPEVIAAADAVTGSVADAGAAVEIRRWI